VTAVLRRAQHRHHARRLHVGAHLATRATAAVARDPVADVRVWIVPYQTGSTITIGSDLRTRFW
jgi:hypothetical protein